MRDRIARSRNLTNLIKLLVHQACAQPLDVTIAQQFRDKPPSEQLHSKMPYIWESTDSLWQSSYFLKHEIRSPHFSISTHSYYSLSYNYWKISSLHSCILCDHPCFAKFGRATFNLGHICTSQGERTHIVRNFFCTKRDMRNIHEKGKGII